MDSALSTSPEMAASISIGTGVVASDSACSSIVTSLGFVNNPFGFYQNTSFVYFIENVEFVDRMPGRMGVFVVEHGWHCSAHCPGLEIPLRASRRLGRLDLTD
jgi:hypothetical protein